MAEKENENYAKNVFVMQIAEWKKSMQIAEWKKRSECGEVCGMMGCESEPTISCPRCGNWYCGEHSLVHLHVV